MLRSTASPLCRNFECSNVIDRNQFIPLRHTMLVKLIRVRRIEQSPSSTLLRFKCSADMYFPALPNTKVSDLSSDKGPPRNISGCAGEMKWSHLDEASHREWYEMKYWNCERQRCVRRNLLLIVFFVKKTSISLQL